MNATRVSDIVIGIDLGTTNSLVAFSDERHGPRIIPGPDGQRLLPSVVYINPRTAQPTVGRDARAHAVERPLETIFSIKRLMGRSLADVTNELPHLPYQVKGSGFGVQGSVEEGTKARRHGGTKGEEDAPRGTGASPVRSSPSPGTPGKGGGEGQSAIPNPQSPIPSIQNRKSKIQNSADPQSALACIAIGPLTYTPQQISAMILAELKRWAEAYLHKPVTKAVITVPAYFDDAQRQATRDAGQIAGLQVLRIVNEPTAAALAYGLDRSEDATIAVYDLGGGTFDISILRIEKGVFRVLATNGDTHLGGDDFDRKLINLFQAEIRRQFGQSIDFDPATQQALRHFAEAVKVQLSDRPQAAVEIDLGALPDAAPGDPARIYRRTIQREEFLQLIEPDVRRTLDRCALALCDAGKTPQQIDRIVMVGGATYTPYVRQRVGEFFGGREPYTALNPMEVVALGAAVQAGVLAGLKRDVLLLDIIPLSLGIETIGGGVSHLIPRGTHVPVQAKDVFSTSVDGQTRVKIHVVQGERQLVKDCRSLGEFILSGLPPMPAGIPKIEVTFLVDASGILSVSAVEQRSGQRASVQIVPAYGLTRGQVSKMIRDSIGHVHEDLLERWLIDLYNRIRFDTAAVEKSLALMADQIDPDYRQELLEIIQGLREMIGWRDPEAIQRAILYMDRKAARLGELAIAKALQETVDENVEGNPPRDADAG